MQYGFKCFPRVELKRRIPGKEEMAMNVDLHDLIQQLACELYLKSGKAEGHDLNNWIEAEWIIKNRFEHTKDLSNIFGEETA
jgi:hypothetical protein